MRGPGFSELDAPERGFLRPACFGLANRLCRQLDYESRARGNIVFDANSAAMLGNDMADNSQPETGAAVLCGEIRQEHLFLIDGRDAATGVGHNQIYGIGGP